MSDNCICFLRSEVKPQGNAAAKRADAYFLPAAYADADFENVEARMKFSIKPKTPFVHQLKTMLQFAGQAFCFCRP